MQNFDTHLQSKNLTTREVIRELRADLHRLSQWDRFHVYLFIFKLRLKRLLARGRLLQQNPPIRILIPAAIIILRIAG